MKFINLIEPNSLFLKLLFHLKEKKKDFILLLLLKPFFSHGFLTSKKCVSIEFWTSQKVVPESFMFNNYFKNIFNR